jgi:hypothetical protein
VYWISINLVFGYIPTVILKVVDVFVPFFVRR